MNASAFAAKLEKLLSSRRLENMEIHDSLASTGDRLLALEKEGAPGGQAVFALCQTDGRGRSGKSFCSPDRKGIYLSYLLRTPLPAERLFSLTPCAAVEICRAVGVLCGTQPEIKWVNDLLFEGRKLCGILTELVPSPGGGSAVIIGVGLNVNSTGEDFPPALGERVCSLKSRFGREFDLAEAAAELIRALDRLNLDFPEKIEEYHREYRERCISIGKDVLVRRGNMVYPAFTLGLDRDFSLLLRLPDGKCETLFAGEVSIRGQNGYI